MTWWGTLLLVAPLLQRAPAPAPRSPDEIVAEQIRARVEAGDPTLYENDALRGFYSRRAFRPAWSHEQGPNRLADDLVGAIERADLDGLEPAEYHLAEIRELLAGVRDDAARGRVTAPARFAELDVLLSDAFLLYGAHLLAGRVDPETLHPRWEANRRGADLATVLEDALGFRKVARALQRLSPADAAYRRLRDALARERAIAEQAPNGWPADLRERLRLEGDLQEGDSLAAAVARFQRRHGLDATGIVDSATRAELAVSPADRVAQLRLNLERWRWLPQDLGRRHIIVNIAAYELHVIDDDEPVLSMRVVVGRAYKRTPIFSDTVRYIVLNPYWRVPRTIAVEDLLPKIQRDPTYIERFGIHVLDGMGPGAPEVDPSTVDWSAETAENFRYRLTQEPGRLNALGRIKFMFPNRYDVYLHDTPARGLFDEAQRDFSHGCIRLEKPLDLAAYLMRKSRWNREAIERGLDEGTERTIYLPRPTPIHLLYWTAWVDQDGTIEFRRDINGVDRPLADALAAPLRPTQEAKRD